MKEKEIKVEDIIFMHDSIRKILHDKSEKPTESGFIVCFGWNSEEKYYFVKGMDYMEVIKRGRKLCLGVSESDFAEGIEKFCGNETFSKWCYLADLLPEEVLDEIKEEKKMSRIINNKS